MTTLILADDHHLIRKSLRMMLESEAGFEIVGEAADGRETIRLVDKLRPTILLLDLALPHIHGLDVVKQVTQQTKTKVIILSMHDAEAYVFEALTNGASGYILKEAMPSELFDAIRRVAAGGTYLSAGLRQESFSSYGKSSSRLNDSENDVLNNLTRREKIVLQHAAEGFNNTEIAKLLSLSPRTVESHRASLMRKLKLRSQTDIVRFAVRKSIISL